MLESKFKNLLAFLKNKNILIITHEPADVDGLGSCFALKEFLEQYFQKKVRIYLSEMTRLAKSVLAKIKLKFPDNDFYLEEDVKLSLIDVILILDTNNLDLLNCVGVDTVPHVFIDHHLWANEEDGKNLDSLNIIMENYTSTAEVIFEIYQNTQVSIPDHVKWLVLSSILTDSGFFKYANNNTLTRFTSILGDTIDIQEIYSFLKIEEEFSEKMARIKGLQRLEIIRENQILIGLSKVSNYESNVANSLINIG
ncbi:MAG: bifunctional oligoribonuclease/PAP phosphatase NrnA, partial [Promethearchaeota archaeon]